MSRFWLFTTLIFLTAAYAVILYFAWLIHDDCLDGLLQLTPADQPLFTQLTQKCSSTAVVFRSTQLFPLVLAIPAALFVYKSKKQPKG